MRAKPPYLGFDWICRQFEIIISATERILTAAQTIIPGTERSLWATERILAVPSIILCRMEKTVWLTDFIPDARGIMSAKPSRIAGETEILIGEASINPFWIGNDRDDCRFHRWCALCRCVRDAPIWHAAFHA